jgi:hypothetical protein
MDKDKSGEISLSEFKALFLEKDYSDNNQIHPI